MLKFTGERIVPGADNCEPTFAQKMYQEHLARYAFAAQICADASVLDVGCGVGYGSKHLAEAGARSIVAIDLSSEAIAHARENFADRRIDFQVASATEFETTERFDLVTCFELIEHVVDQRAVLKTIRDHLRPDGFLVISTPRPLGPIRSAFHEKELAFHDFRDLLKSYFDNARFYQENNYFTSIVHADSPSSIRNIKPVAEPKGLSAADYFVAVASNVGIDAFRNLDTVLTLNDDSYVLRLESDYKILRESEDRLVAERETLRAQASEASEAVAKAEATEQGLRCELEESQRDARDALRSINRLEHALEAASAGTADLQIRLGNEQAAQQARYDADQAEQQARHDAEQAAQQVRYDADQAEQQASHDAQQAAQQAHYDTELAAIRQAATLARRADAEAVLDLESRRKLEASVAYVEKKSGEIIAQLLQGGGDRLEKAKSVIRARLARERRKSGMRARRVLARQLQARQRILVGSGIWPTEDYWDFSGSPTGDMQAAIEHYASQGWRELRSFHPLFDPGWYLAEHGDVLAANHEPLTHYIEYGVREGRQPNVGFDSTWYLQRYPDVAEAGLNPLAHYILHGATEGRWPHPLFDPAWYAATYDIPKGAPWSALAHYVTIGAAKGLRPNRLFDPTWYLTTNLDVARNDIDPLWHYLHHGWREKRRPSREFDNDLYLYKSAELLRSGINPLVHHLHASGGSASVPPLDGTDDGRTVAARGIRPHIVYVGHEPDNLSHAYRVRHPVEILNGLGLSARWIREAELLERLDLLAAAEVVVFARMAWVAPIQLAVERCRAAGVKVVYDIDDYVFDPAVANAQNVDGLRELSRDDLTGYYMGVALYNRMLLESDAVLASTGLLVHAATQFGKTALLLPNSTRESVLGASAEAVLARAERVRSETVVIGYASGTKTHQRDFAQVARALGRIMSLHPQTRLRVVGHLDLAEFPALEPFADRIERRGLVEIDRLPFEYAHSDINLAPLEIGNPYCEAKSALKFIEAALVGVPTVASATGPYREAIVDGETGFLASSEAEWFEKLETLVGDGERREAMGRRALQECTEVRPQAYRQTVRTVFSELLRRPAQQGVALAERRESAQPDGSPGPRLRIGWIVPGLLIGGGGHRNILRAAHFLQGFGHDVALYFTDTTETSDTLRGLVRQHFYPFEGEVFVYDGNGRGEDVMFATHWSTVGPAERMTPPAGEILYFVQDFEPSFTAMSAEYVLAENTYRKGLYAITSGRWCEVMLRERYGMEADHFTFPIDRAVYHLRPEIPRRNRVAFFAKPEMPRRCFELGLRTLRLLHQRRPDIEIVFFGSSHARGLVDYPVTFMDVLPGIADLAELYAGARLGLVFSTTNPSLVPYEMMACGLPVVDLDREGNAVNYADRTDIAFLANPDPDVMVTQIELLLEDDAALARRSRNGVDFVSGFPTEEEMARKVERLILERVLHSERRRRELNEKEALCQVAAVV